MDLTGKGLIEFEGITLAKGAKYFELLPFFKKLPDKTRNLLFDLRYSWARQRSTPSRNIRSVCRKIEQRLRKEEDLVASYLLEHDANLPLPAAELIADWFSALEKMARLSRETKMCTWTTLPLEGEVERNFEHSLRMWNKIVQNSEICSPQGVEIIPKSVFNPYNLSTDEEKIRFCCLLSDAYSDPNV